ncbi:hypothetical protein BY996DRAFT_1453367 [Phakopsora pachyrhizi]|uniref:Uncharacterized protein n=1 Tax=Phakopsora pachyrhizi TaxID=170000 RepID=A0AAV0BE59_PHAPC|nr:hypothetical protein BY996DRAFT_1453367 [Phakopsora pachyrhizi]CAH7685544.1 hypothetical protein PPACK8108_LOCUS20089 [Phakopsora pachyrhizi]
MIRNQLSSGLLRQRLARPRLANVYSGQPRYLSLPPRNSSVIASLDSGPNRRRLGPFPESAKGQAGAALRTYAQILKAMAYGGVGLGVAAAFAFFGLHVWVEYLELPPGKRGQKNWDSFYGWDDEFVGWGAGYLGGGTDPRIGWRARSLVRAAWVAENWQSDQVADKSDDSASYLVDSAYTSAQASLEEAVSMAKEAGLKLDQQNTPDRGLVELQSRLANVYEKINTPLSLVKAFQIYLNIWNACVAFIDRQEDQKGSGIWEMREALRVALVLGDIGLKISSSQASGGQESTSVNKTEAEQYLTWAISTGLGEAVGDGSIFRLHCSDHKRPTSQDNLKGSLLSLSWLGQQGNNSTQLSNSLRSTIDLINYTLEALAFSQVDNKTISKKERLNDTFPAAIRATVSSLIRFSVHLVSSDHGVAYEFQNHLRSFLRSITSEIEPSGASPDANLHYLWLRSREALSSIYLAEIGYASKNLDDTAVISQCLTALEKLDAILIALESPEESFQPGRTRQSSGRLFEVTKALRRDTRLTAAMASNIIGLRLEDCQSDVIGNLRARFKDSSISPSEFFKRAMRYSNGSFEEEERLSQAFHESERNLSRVEERLRSD